MTRNRPTIMDAKEEAKLLRADLAARGEAISHAQALERIAQRHGFRDWNALHAARRDAHPQGWASGGRVSGRYLGQPFTATVLTADQLRPGWVRMVLDLDEAVDVVRFDSFSNLRKRIRVEVGPDGHSRERTSDGVPHVELDP
ncbi:glyoxalase superfamily protein [Roseibacterium sp. SDUM158016]|uniref:glyoxalase superfamily protein n=1 Tax=Roseicyclus sediminis TaxID=2980997 RepID=UPI0021D3A8BA|nr:glyoxalase superfamily protein [Roseibacterium sp. SDUM158016]MCU4654262.1 glyoxalase superfamily protein [Roseibacterium sp. SDUM158016]